MNADRQPDARDRQSRGDLLSTLADGEAPATAADEACRQWQTDDALRSDWHVYHLIGDVLRSDELASTPARDAAFVHAVRARLADEPVPLAPRPLPAAAPRVRRWLAPAAVAAGFAVVGVGVFVLRADKAGPTGWDDRMAITQTPGSDTLRRVRSSAAPASAQALVKLQCRSAARAARGSAASSTAVDKVHRRNRRIVDSSMASRAPVSAAQPAQNILQTHRTAGRHGRPVADLGMMPAADPSAIP